MRYIHCEVTETDFIIEVPDNATNDDINEIACGYIANNIGAYWDGCDED